MVIEELLSLGARQLKQAGICTYVADSQRLLAHFLGVDRIYLIINKKRDAGQARGYFDLLRRRSRFEPIQYLVGSCEFMSLPFLVREGVLIPRPETELLAETVIAHVGGRAATMLEVGTGSGCVSISCARYCPSLSVDAVDISPKALAAARENADALGAADRIHFHRLDILNAPPPSAFYDVLVSNPPYIESGEIPGLMPEVSLFEPHEALDGGADGLVFYRRLAQLAPNTGFFALEVGHTQSGAVAQLLADSGCAEIRRHLDFQGIERVITAKGGFR